MTHVMPIVSVNTGPTALLGMPGKSPVVGGTPILLNLTGLEGDGAAATDQDSVLSFYPRTHYTQCVNEFDRVVVPGDFNDHVTVDLTEEDVMIGDRWIWGDESDEGDESRRVVLEITRPRRPDEITLAIPDGEEIVRRMVEEGRCGWHCKVLSPGMVPTVGELRLLSRPAKTTSVAEAFRLMIVEEDATVEILTSQD